MRARRIGIVGLVLRSGRVEQLARSRGVLGARAAGEQAVVTDAVEAAGQHVDEKASDELACIERHRLEPVVPFGPIVLPPEGDAGWV